MAASFGYTVYHAPIRYTGIRKKQKIFKRIRQQVSLPFNGSISMLVFTPKICGSTLSI